MANLQWPWFESACTIAGVLALTAENGDDSGASEELRQEFDVSPDGRRVLMSDIAEWTTPITLILNWRPPSK